MDALAKRLTVFDDGVEEGQALFLGGLGKTTRENQRKPGQRQLATHETQITSATQKLTQAQGQRKDRKGKVPNHHFHNLRRNTRGPRRTRFWGGRGLGREDRECKDGHGKAEGRRSGLKGLLPRGRWPELARWRRLGRPFGPARPSRRPRGFARAARRVPAGPSSYPKDPPPPEASPSSRSAVSEAVVVCD